ncbi:conserved exported hypothetical protein [Planktothrix serta PCC 8927]|uniref:Low temperature-induced protein n=1 Tax=Planktothrix serta PCC 8927 TaxID=671068 RepID=A0A7Z9BV56_9CYAN|nr:hypothetical protein [Planktothrix serta]VXD23134.1 conserved exported hypothetical protein [Planktothrix serta PCC 8927]
MKFPSINVSNLRPLRFLMVALLCAFLWIGYAIPSLAAVSSPSKGEDALKQIQKDSEQVLRGGPPSLKDVQAKTNEGLNVVQGDADKEKMKNPGNTQNSTDVEEKITEGMDKIRDIFTP